MRRRQQGRLVRWAALVLGTLALAVAARGLERHNTWYLASDQFAFLTFAADLASGTVFHDTSAFDMVVPKPNPERTYDVLAQTYFWREGKLYSRYPPGFPALLTAAGMVGGEVAQHWLNPVLYLTILALVGFLAWELVRPNDRALAAGSAVTAMWLLLLLPTDVHLWGITVARDLPAHLLALLAILAAVRLRWMVCGLLLGLACTIRPDAVLYGASLGALFRVEGARLRDMLLGAAAFAVGALPLFAYNTVTQGHPFAFTQGGEFREVLGMVRTPAVAVAQVFGSGGAFRLDNLWQTLPGNLSHLGRSFGWLSVLTVLGAVWGVRVRRPLAAAFVPYPVVAVLFYSCWSHPDARYLAGAALCLIPLTAVGATVACRLVADEKRSHAWRVAALVVAAVVLGRSWLPPALRLPGIGATESVLAAALAVAALLPLVPRFGRAISRVAPLAPALSLTGIALFIMLTSRGARDPFQRAQIERSRGVLGALIPPGSLVITSESLGRPAENLTHYVGVDAFYLAEFPLFVVAREGAVGRYLTHGRRAFFLLRGEDRNTLRTLGAEQPKLVARAKGNELYDWFVDPASAPFGAALYEIEPSPLTRGVRDLFQQRKR